MTDSPTWIQEMLGHLKRTPEYPVVQHYDVTTSLFLFACLEIAISKRQRYTIRTNVRISIFLPGRRVPFLRLNHQHQTCFLKKIHPEQNTLPNAPFKKIIRASEVEVVGATFPVHSLTNNITD